MRELQKLNERIMEIMEMNDEGNIIYKEASELHSQISDAIDVLNDLEYIRKFVDENL